LTTEGTKADAPVVTISVLGPFGVDGDSSSLAPRDRVVLEVLVVRLGEVVSAERLADAMWGGLPPPRTWTKVVQGSVVRLRKVLGPEAIETSPSGYRLRTPPDQVDAHRFERLTRRGSELLALGEYDRAAYITGEALALWRGPALRELEGWDAGRIEAGRLEELRLDAEEIRLEAALRAGRQREVLAEAQARAAEAPLRERRWALLALAQYQVGRQGDALRTLHHARRMLLTELGLEPSAELVDLERAILQQDPSLVAAAALPEPAAVCPYRGLLPYDIADADGFFGREGEIEASLSRLTAVGVLMVVGPSGNGKSSLVRAGVGAALQANGREVVVISPGPRPMDALSGLPVSGQGAVLVVDQCEEVLTLGDDPADQSRFFAALAAHAERGPLVVALRADRLGDLSAHPDFARLVEPGLHLLSAMSEGDLRAAIEAPARQAGLLLEPGLVDLLVREVAGEPGALPLLSHALHQTWQRREGRTLTVDGYRQTGGIRGAVAQSAEAVYDQVPEEQRPLLRDLLLRLVAPSPEGEPVRSRIPRRTIATDSQHERLIELLVQARLVTSDDQTVELAHESLARAWPRLQTWLDDDVEGQRILRHLSLTADTWDGMARPDSELYRGVRLAQARDWQSRAHPHLTPAEAAFLDASAERERAEAATAEQRLRQQTRQNRRLRALLAGAAVLLVVALVTGLLAVRQARRADRAAVAADARRVGAQAQVVEDLDRSMLLAVQGMRLDDSTDTRANVLAALGRSPELVASTRTNGPPHISLEVSPDGSVVGIGAAYGFASFFDMDTRKQFRAYDEMPVWKFEFRADGRQLAFTAQDSPDSGIPLPRQTVRLVDATTLKEEPRQPGGLPEGLWPTAPHYSADGRLLAAAFEDLDDVDESASSSVIVWDVAEPEQPVLDLEFPGSVVEVDLGPDGSVLYVGTAEPPTVTAYDVATGRVLRSASAPGAWVELSPDGSILATVGGNTITLLDAATLTELRRLEGHTGWVQVMRFSHDGELLATGADDRLVMVWDVASGDRQEVLRGYSSSVWGLGFSPDDETLHTVSGRTWLSWDLVGDRRFITRMPLAEPAAPDAGAALASPSGEAVAYLRGATDETTGKAVAFLQLLDLDEGRAGEMVDTGHVHLGGAEQPLAGAAGLSWRPDGRRLATTGEDGFVRVWDRQTVQLLVERQLSEGQLAAISYTGDGSRLVVASEQGSVLTLDAETLQSDGRTVELHQEVTSVHASPDNRTAIAFTVDQFTLIDLGTGRLLHDGDVGLAPSSGDFSPDSRHFAVGGVTGQVRVLDVQTGEWAGPPRTGHDGAVTVAYSPDGATLASGAFDGTIGLWEGRTGALSNTVPSGRTTNVQPTFLPDGHTLLIPSIDATVSTWDTQPASWIEFACAIAGRDLTQEEWHDAFGDRPYRQTCPTKSNT
jgi:WD40 repeat protein/DNA-binding SARP family transcriptional activator